MNYYDNISKDEFLKQHFAFLEISEAEKVLTITLDREQKKNALHPQMVNEIAYAMQYAHSNQAIWIVVFQANGNVFCAGADLKAMMGMAEENDSSIPAPNKPILVAHLFSGIHKPCIAKVEGDVFAGGFFFLAGCHIVLALEGLKFGLPEVKRGLYPFQVMESLMKVMPARKVIDWCIRGYNLPVAEALKYGLVTEVVPRDKMDELAASVLDELKQNSPTAIRLGLEALEKIQSSSDHHEYLMGMLMKAIGSKDGQEGLTAFREKRSPNWTGE